MMLWKIDEEPWGYMTLNFWKNDLFFMQIRRQDFEFAVKLQFDYGIGERRLKMIRFFFFQKVIKKYSSDVVTMV